MVGLSDESVPTSSPRNGESPDDMNAVPSASSSSGPKYEYDVAISFAGPQRDLAERLATVVREAGCSVFYDNFYADHLWGKDLPSFFDEIYRKKSLYCVPFISQEYKDRMWTKWERRSATTRLLQERGGDYVLPIIVEDVDVPGIPSTIGHLSLAQYTIEEIAQLLIKKVNRTRSSARADQN